MKTTLARMRQLIGSPADWTANDLVIGDGELALETKTSGEAPRFKVGDGIRRYSELPEVMSYLLDAPGSVPVPIDDLLAVFVSVLNFGADPTGSDDSSAAIQAGIDALFARGGGVLLIPAGTYKTSVSLKHKDNVTLRGEGSLCARIVLDNNAASVIEHTSAAASGARRAARGQSIIGLMLEHSGLPANRYAFPSANGIGVLDYGAYSITASAGVYDDVVIVNACDGLSIGGELFAYRIGIVETQYCYKPWNKRGTGACTSITVEFFRMFTCFHGMTLNNTTYSEINFYADHCGLEPSAGFGPANEMPIMFDANACHLTIPTFGMELSPAVLFRARGFSKINIGSAGLVFSNASVWKASATRIANIPQAEQALLVSLGSGSAVSWSSFDIDMQVANGFPTAAANASNLYYIPAGDQSRLVFKSASIYTDSYFWTAPARLTLQSQFSVMTDPNADVRECVVAYAYHATSGLIALASIDSLLWKGLPQKAEFGPTLSITPASVGKSVVIYTQPTGGAASLSGTFTSGDVVMLYNSTGNATGVLITPTGISLRWAGNTDVSAPRRLGNNGFATLLFIQPNVAVMSGWGIT
jgi:hypothetical protein